MTVGSFEVMYDKKLTMIGITMKTMKRKEDIPQVIDHNNEGIQDRHKKERGQTKSSFLKQKFLSMFFFYEYLLKFLGIKFTGRPSLSIYSTVFKLLRIFTLKIAKISHKSTAEFTFLYC
jgi:hypothetical protein